MKKYSIWVLMPVLCGFILISTASVQSAGNKTGVEALIPYGSSLFIYGYSAPNSVVYAEGTRTYGETTTDTTGYFSFNRLSIAREATELCFSTLDADRRTGFPLCIRTPRQTEQEVGPLLLSPTVSLSNNSIRENQNAYALGKTIPRAEVQISFFEVTDQERKQLSSQVNQLLDMSVYAKDLAPFATTADENGNFSFSIPTSKPLTYRLFVKGIYEKQPTPKSKTISYSIESLQSILGRIILILILLIIAFTVAGISLRYYEKKTGRFHRLAFVVIEMRLKPFGVKILLRLRRAMYKLQVLLKSRQKELFRKRR